MIQQKQIFTLTFEKQLFSLVLRGHQWRFTVPDAVGVADIFTAEAGVPERILCVDGTVWPEVATFEVLTKSDALSFCPVLRRHGTSSSLRVDKHGSATHLAEFQLHPSPVCGKKQGQSMESVSELLSYLDRES